MNLPLKPDEVNREGIRDLSPRKVQAARAEGKPFKLIAAGEASRRRKLTATVRPEQIAASDPLGNVRGLSLAISFRMDMMPGLTITSHRPNLQSTAYGLLPTLSTQTKINLPKWSSSLEFKLQLAWHCSNNLKVEL